MKQLKANVFFDFHYLLLTLRCRVGHALAFELLLFCRFLFDLSEQFAVPELFDVHLEQVVFA